jgi:hypothetical protein
MHLFGRGAAVVLEGELSVRGGDGFAVVELANS